MAAETDKVEGGSWIKWVSFVEVSATQHATLWNLCCPGGVGPGSRMQVDRLINREQSGILE